MVSTGSSKSSEKGSKKDTSKTVVPLKVPAISDPNTMEEKTTQQRKASKEVSLPLHDRPNPAKNIDLPMFKSSTIKVTQTLKAHTMAVSGLVI